MLQFHCSFQNFNGIVTLIPAENSVCILNKVEIKEATKLSQGKQFLKVYFLFLRIFNKKNVHLGDLIILGTHVLRFNHPEEAARLREKKQVSNT